MNRRDKSLLNFKIPFIRYRIIASIIFLITASLHLCSQNENTKWFVGHQDEGMTYDKPDTGQNRLFGMSILNFNQDGTISQTRHAKSLGMTWNVINFCDTSGNLLFYSNGSKVFNFEHKLIEGADSLNYSKYWTLNNKQGVFGNYLIGSYPYSMIAFRSPSNNNQYYLVSTIMNYDSLAQTKWLQFHKVSYSIIDMSLNNGRGKMIVKEKLLLYGNFSHAIAACKHANGRDWWISAREYKTNCYYYFKLDTGGIRYDHKQCIGLPYLDFFPDSVHGSFGQIYSHDGSKFAISSQRGIELFDFDRRLGKLSNARFAPRPYTASLYKQYQMADVFFSPDNNLLYLNLGGNSVLPNIAKVYQYDTRGNKFHESGIVVAIYDGFKYYPSGNPNLVSSNTTFYTMQLAPNGKIYIGTGETTAYMHEIEFPNIRGMGCNLKQHSVKLMTIGAGVPNFPNYSLAPLDTCMGLDLGVWGTDTSIYGMDTVAEYQWLYCDSGYKPVPNATTRIYIQPHDGLYAARVKCGKTIDTTKCYYYFKRRSGIQSNGMRDIKIYPNPTSDYIEILPTSVIPSQVRNLTITNLLGQSFYPPVISTNEGIALDVRDLPQGIYLLQLRDKNDTQIKTERIVIQRDQ